MQEQGNGVSPTDGVASPVKVVQENLRVHLRLWVMRNG